MNDLISELRDVERKLVAFTVAKQEPAITRPLDTLEEIAKEVGKAWSGSWFGYHSKVYYKGFKSPPPGAHFSSEWGLDSAMGMGTRGDWTEYDFDTVVRQIHSRAGNPDLGPAKEAAAQAEQLFGEAQDQIISILEAASSRVKDAYLGRLLEDTTKIKLVTASDFVSYMRPSGTLMSRDSLAINQGLWKPPHVDVLADVAALRVPASGCSKLASIAQKAASHLERVSGQQRRSERIGTNVFIGHGRSLLWKDLKDFVQDRLHLPWDEFNRVPVAGVTNIARLSEMLDAAAIAFVIMTAEDEQADGKLRARMNVVHEVGLFQGRLGFTKAIVLLEEGCEEFSNIQGLGQIRFPKGNIKAAFEDIRQVLEREGLIETGA